MSNVEWVSVVICNVFFHFTISYTNEENVSNEYPSPCEAYKIDMRIYTYCSKQWAVTVCDRAL